MGKLEENVITVVSWLLYLRLAEKNGLEGLVHIIEYGQGQTTTLSSVAADLGFRTRGTLNSKESTNLLLGQNFLEKA